MLKETNIPYVEKSSRRVCHLQDQPRYSFIIRKYFFSSFSRIC